MRHEIYVDENSQNGHRHIVLTSALVDGTNRVLIKNAIHQVRICHDLSMQLKWGKVSAAMLHGYKAYIDKFFEFLDHEMIEFHSLVVDCHQLNHRRYNDGNLGRGRK